MLCRFIYKKLMEMIKHLFTALFVSALLFSCNEPQEKPISKNIDQEERKAKLSASDSLYTGKSYLPVYSQIYHHEAQKTVNLTITVSLRNVSASDTLFLKSAKLFDTAGQEVKQYLNHPVYLTPMETVEVVIAEMDTAGGTGGNFIFDWAIGDQNNPPLFEAVMISTLGQQGISFTSRAVRIYE